LIRREPALAPEAIVLFEERLRPACFNVLQCGTNAAIHFLPLFPLGNQLSQRDRSAVRQLLSGKPVEGV